MKRHLKTLFSLVAVGLVTAVLFTQPASAIPITGSVDMSGTVFLNNMNLGSATAATAFSGVTVGGVPTGSFAGTAGSSVTWNPFGWNPATTPVTPLWSFVFGAFTYSFDLASVSVVSQSNFFLNLVGVGTLRITGAGSPFDPTTAQWSFTISNPTGGAHANFAFTFANSQTSVPEGGSTAALLGFAGLTLMAAEGLRRRLIKANRSS